MGSRRGPTHHRPRIEEALWKSPEAVRGIDLDVHKGEVFALLGPNGAGKTTTVEILEGIRSRSAGDVQVLGSDPAQDRRSWRARIGVVPQSTGVYLDLTVGEVIGHFAAFYPAPLPVAQVLDMVGLTEQRKKQTVALSGGQQRRLDVAVGVIGDPELIFLDEPTTGLDPVARREAWDLVRYFADRGKTTVLTTHYLDEAEALAQRAGDHRRRPGSGIAARCTNSAGGLTRRQPSRSCARPRWPGVSCRRCPAAARWRRTAPPSAS